MTGQYQKQAVISKIALVTGASSGIGSAISKLLTSRGFFVVAVARREDRLNSLVKEIADSGGEAVYFTIDLLKEAERLQLAQTVLGRFGAPDILINNAGAGWYGYDAEMPWALANDLIQLNIASIVHLTSLFLPAMLERRSGHIINIGSIIGDMPSQGVVIYSATKSFLNSYSTALNRELKGSGVFVSIVKPGPVTTEFFDRVASQPSGTYIPVVEHLGVTAEYVAKQVSALIKRPRRVIYVPFWLAIIPWIELCLGWLMDLMGPFLLRLLHTSSKMAAPKSRTQA